MCSKYHNTAQWLEIGGKRSYFRSKLEANFAHYLEWLKYCGIIASWDHEPETFKLNGRQGTVSLYKPDFKAVDVKGGVNWYEVKGWMDKRSKSKINAFLKQYPQHKLTVIDKNWFKINDSKLQGLVRGWR